MSAAKKPAQTNSLLSYFGKTAAKPAAPTSNGASTTAAPKLLTPPTSTSKPIVIMTPEQKAAVEANRQKALAIREANKAASNPAGAVGITDTPVFQRAAHPSAATNPFKLRATTPPSAAKAEPIVKMEDVSYSASGRKRKQIMYTEDEDDDDAAQTPTPQQSSASKRRKAESDDEYEADKDAKMESEEEEESAASEEENGEEEEDEEEKKTAKKSSSKKKGAKAPAKTAAAKRAASKMDMSDDDEGGHVNISKKEYDVPWLHNPRDMKLRTPDDPNYDRTKLFIPTAAWAKMTPAEEQYWKIKQQNFDLVLFFKIGKFYELFDGDADIGVQQLGLNYMLNQARPHAGFPEAAFNKVKIRTIAEFTSVSTSAHCLLSLVLVFESASPVGL